VVGWVDVTVQAQDLELLTVHQHNLSTGNIRSCSSGTGLINPACFLVDDFIFELVHGVYSYWLLVVDVGACAPLGLTIEVSVTVQAQLNRQRHQGGAICYRANVGADHGAQLTGCAATVTRCYVLLDHFDLALLLLCHGVYSYWLHGELAMTQL
jgi:hypothetical protein